MIYDCIIIGGGLVGLGTAYRLLEFRPGIRVLVLEKESRVASHQSTRNSGVIHAGVYYKPGSFKARLCAEGRRSLIEFARNHGVQFEICGKVVVATDSSELERLESIRQRADANGVSVRKISLAELHELEPHANGVAALHVSDTGIVDFRGIAEALCSEIKGQGGEILCGHSVQDIVRADRRWVVRGEFGEYSAQFIINCGGLHCDRLVEMTGRVSPLQIVPFRGEYYLLNETAKKLCRNLIYPVPDPNFPFLGVHFTRRFDGDVECGPNAVLGFAREGYSWRDVSFSDLSRMARYSGVRKLMRKHWRVGLAEMYRSLVKKAFVGALQKLVPEVRADDLIAAEAGVRAQAVRPDGVLEDDFFFHRVEGALHVLNAPSPAATGCLAIGGIIAQQVLDS